MVPLWYEHGPVREGILKTRKGPECTLGGREPLWVYFKPKTVTLYFYFWRFFRKHPSWSLVGFLRAPPPPKKKIPSRRNIEGSPRVCFAIYPLLFCDFLLLCVFPFFLSPIGEKNRRRSNSPFRERRRRASSPLLERRRRASSPLRERRRRASSPPRERRRRASSPLRERRRRASPPHPLLDSTLCPQGRP